MSTSSVKNYNFFFYTNKKNPPALNTEKIHFSRCYTVFFFFFFLYFFPRTRFRHVRLSPHELSCIVLELIDRSIDRENNINKTTFKIYIYYSFVIKKKYTHNNITDTLFYCSNRISYKCRRRPLKTTIFFFYTNKKNPPALNTEKIHFSRCYTVFFFW